MRISEHLRKALDKVNVGERKQIAEAKPECESMAVSAAELIISKTVDAKRGYARNVRGRKASLESRTESMNSRPVGTGAEEQRQCLESTVVMSQRYTA